MHTINDLRAILGLKTINQVRNRMDAVKDLLAGLIRRGSNNQILIIDEGVEILRRLQDLYDSGLTITEASEALRASFELNAYKANSNINGLISSRSKQGDIAYHSRDAQLIERLISEIEFLRERIRYLEHAQTLDNQQRTEDRPKWWESLRGDSNGI
ncbi:TPA: hypothetical protein DD712_04150 [Candidatus Acetothermia bacterium]|nr:hypothetical protein [Candidatus Acetothermia bacterium]